VKGTRALWIGLLVLAVLTPLGLLLPHWLHGGTAWGEWSPQEVKERTGSVPEGMARQGEAYKAPLSDYAAPRRGPHSLAHQSAWYMLAGIAGMAVVVGLMLLLGRWLTRHERAADVDS